MSFPLFLRRGRPAAPWLFALAILALPYHGAWPARTVPLSTQLADLVTQGRALDTQLASITLTGDNHCTELGSANAALADYLASIDTVYAGLGAPLTLDTASLASLDELSNLAMSIGGRAMTLSLQLRTLSDSAGLVEYQASLSAMLRLSDDIGSMADRILDMANKILVMADNIGLMADRILVTQQLQNTNIALTQASILATQQNMIVLSDTLGTLAYNTPLGGLVSNGNALVSQLGAVSLTATGMDTQLAGVEAAVTTYLNGVVALYTVVSRDSALASYYVNGDTLTMLGDLSGIQTALAAALAGYANAINQLAPLTATPVLADATASMLRLTQDINVMSGRIVEMGDGIIVMADNIGIMAGRIVDTQALQQTNIDLTQDSLLTAQSVTVGVIAGAGL
ncbi:MAG TPA: hypothetical protein VGA00_07745 [Acidiferrobacterales bacterium]